MLWRTGQKQRTQAHRLQATLTGWKIIASFWTARVRLTIRFLTCLRRFRKCNFWGYCGSNASHTRNQRPNIGSYCKNSGGEGQEAIRRRKWRALPTFKRRGPEVIRNCPNASEQLPFAESGRYKGLYDTQGIRKQWLRQCSGDSRHRDSQQLHHVRCKHGNIYELW